MVGSATATEAEEMAKEGAEKEAEAMAKMEVAAREAPGIAH